MAVNNLTSHADLIQIQLYKDGIIMGASNMTPKGFLGVSSNLTSRMNGGNSFTIAKQPSVTLGNHTEATADTAAQFSLSLVTIGSPANKRVLLHNATEIFGANSTNVDIGVAQFQSAAQNAMLLVDTALGATYSSAALGTAANETTNITEALVDEAAYKLTDAGCPETGASPGAFRFLVVTPRDALALSAIDRFSAVEKIGDPSAIKTGMVGMIKGFKVFVSSQVAESTSETHNIAGYFDPNDPSMCTFGHWFANLDPGPTYLDPSKRIWVPEVGILATFDFNNDRGTADVAVHCKYAVGMIRSEWAVDLRTQNT